MEKIGRAIRPKPQTPRVYVRTASITEHELIANSKRINPNIQAFIAHALTAALKRLAIIAQLLVILRRHGYDTY